MSSNDLKPSSFGWGMRIVGKIEGKTRGGKEKERKIEN